jgi:hypothetical protein
MREDATVREVAAAERRQDTRVPVYLDAALEREQAQRAVRVLDLSVGGAFVAVAAPLPRDTLCTLRFQLGRKTVLVRAMTRWGRTGEAKEISGNGFEFLDLGPEEAALVAALEPGREAPCQLRAHVCLEHPSDTRVVVTIYGALGPVRDLLATRITAELPLTAGALLDAHRYELNEKEAHASIVAMLARLVLQARGCAIVLPARAIARVQLLRLLRGANLAEAAFCTLEHGAAERFLDAGERR